MANKTYTKLNFHSHTFCIWKEVPFAEIKDLKINYTSQSGSQYIFTAEGLYRISNHWGRVANCHWRLIPLTEFKNQNITVAFAHWTDFYSNDDTSKLFFIKVNWETTEVNFYHKNTAEANEKVVLRNAKETAKTIRTIKEVLTQEDWAKYLKYEDLDTLRKEIANELVTTSKTFLEVKKKYLS
ncbi:hypothetical protein HKT18_13065 [Flavobacterium sp. IMCC34852]|uniref:Uncharacterized protein n=1 Tax=Flavobacterium rivulicola TaxID=2732161 RepID=A0A7Y3RAW4_9FLAO|nr:hypothetical protein [Flavobacterium sp. IMCC34852]NNT73149.1 hypothetical protein [Flavobacterium sp. IMCC34852]